MSSCLLVKILITLSIILFHSQFRAQVREDQIIVTDEGVMQWRHDNSEVTGFGINYTVPFAHAYRSGKKLGVDLRAAIDHEVYHFARLGLELFRVHGWDCEISDTVGNLLDNKHLELFDYLLYKLKERKINAVITPIAYWGNGWPDRDEPTPGFSTKYGKDNCLTNPDAIIAQENYLQQFIRHINRYSGIAYKDDPQILAIEICNEPHHRGSPTEVTAFVKRMKEAVRSTGCTKPVFYNVTHATNLAEAYFEAGIDGGTFQWYPTGLGFQKELGGNMLPNVDRYEIPFEEVLRKNGAARFVYEFDAADMATSYMYPAMARSFRSAGMQLATHFSYDPTFLAPYNTEYNTHYMNLAYAPQKALSLMICAEVFRNIPLYTDFGVYPDNTTFGPFRVSYEDNLAEMVTEEKFIYTNHTTTKIENPGKLKLIAGYGNSQLVEYEGAGAYFLDKLGEGIWRLELMPDAIVVDNLFGRNSLDKTRAVIHHGKRDMQFNLPEFANGYFIQSVDWRDSIIYREVREEYVGLKPGVYLLMAPEYDQLDSILIEAKVGSRLDEYFAPAPVTNIIIKSRNIESPRWRRPVLKYDMGSEPFPLFSPSRDSSYMNRRWISGSKLVHSKDADPVSHLYIKLNGLTDFDNESPEAKPIGDYSMRYYFGDILEGTKIDLSNKKFLIVNAHTPDDFLFPIQISLVMKDGSAFGHIIQLDSTTLTHRISIDDLKRVKPVLLPRPYPTFLPYYSEAGKSGKINLSQVESMPISIGPGIPKEEWDKTYELILGNIWLE